MESRGEGSKAEVVEEFLRELYTTVLRELESEVDEAKRYLKFLAWLNTRLEERRLGRIIITEGFAVEVYTGRAYRTMDVDIIVEGMHAVGVVEEFLKRIGERVGRGYLPLIGAISAKSIDIVSTVYDREMKPIKLIVDERHVYLEPPEELLLRYLTAWKSWNSIEDRDKVIWLYYVWRSRMDLDYVIRRARQENIYDKLVELQRIISSAFKNAEHGGRIDQLVNR